MAMISKYKGHDIEFIEFDIKSDSYSLYNTENRLVFVLQRHEYLSQPQLRRIGNSSGRHRQPSPKVYVRPSGQSNSAGSAGTKGAVGTFSFGPGTVGNTGSISIGSIAGGFVTLIMDAMRPAELEDASIRVGEIIGRRCWWVVKDDPFGPSCYFVTNRDAVSFRGDINDPGWLHSVYMSHVRWLPNVPIVGDVVRDMGVHAFKTDDGLFEYQSQFLNSQSYDRTMVSGTVAMWGDIVEHQKGYRAQYAKVLSLDTTNKALRHKYGVG
jgi:hypothetical protein